MNPPGQTRKGGGRQHGILNRLMLSVQVPFSRIHGVASPRCDVHPMPLTETGYSWSTLFAARAEVGNP